MKKVIFSSFNFSPSFLGPTLDVLQSAIDEGDEVTLITCLKSVPSCGFNAFELKYMCDLCTYRFNKIKTSIHGKYTLKKMSALFLPGDFKEAENFVAGVPSITKETYYGTFDVGESIISSYISKTRDRDMELGVSEEVLPPLAIQTIVVYNSVKRFLKENGIEQVWIFNGRWDYYRAVFRAASELGIPCMIYENFRSGGFIELYGNNFPHIIKNKQAKYDQYWHSGEMTLSEKKEIARQYFSRKRSGEVVIGKSYTKDQVQSLLPPGIDQSKKILVLFNSSDDEFAAVAGDEYKNPFFENQVEGILEVAKLVSEHLASDFMLLIRMHPNLKGVDFHYVKRLYELKHKYQNVLLIEPESAVDSYALMDLAFKVITFGSSIGVEANYWRKPVILLGKPSYFYSDLAYLPENKEGILKLLIQDLEPKPIENSEKIAFYQMKGGVKAKYYDYVFRKKYFFKGLRIDTLPFIARSYFRLTKALKIRNKRIIK
jgi:hypothetical protein